MEDPRRTTKGNFPHPLSDILFLVVSAVVSGADDWETIVLFGGNQLKWLKKYGGYENGIPSCDTLKRVFSALDTKCFNACFMDWAKDICELGAGEVVAVDGKAIRGTKQKKLPHIVSAFAAGNRLTLGQVATDEKSNEITAIPELLGLSDIGGTRVTIDAMGCQREIAKKIIGKGADYLLAVKGNRAGLEEAILDTVRLEAPVDTNVQSDLGHGRIGTRTCWAYDGLGHIGESEKWAGLRTLARVEAIRIDKKTGKQSKEQRIYISSLAADAKILNESARKHWAVENNLHWTLDVLFGEDASRKRKGNAAENFNIVFKTALVLYHLNGTG